MIVCPICGFRNMDANNRCFKCSALLKRDEKTFSESRRSSARRSRREFVHSIVNIPLDRLKHHPALTRIFAVPDHGHFRYPFTAGLLNLVPGLGYFYVGQRVRGVFTFVVMAAVIAVAVVTITHPLSNWLLFTLLGLFFFLWADGVAIAARVNGDTWRLRKTLALACGAMMIVGTSLTVAQWFGMDFLTLQKISHNVMPPNLRAGDRVAVSDVPLWFRSPRVGEVVMFNPPRFTAEQGSNVLSINISKYIQRVVGGPGDHIVKKGIVFYRNGKALPPDEVPFRGDVLPDFETVVPEGSYFLPVTGIPRDALASLMGAPHIGYVGEAGYNFNTFPAFANIPEGDISSLALGIASPPERRKWFSDDK